MTDLSILSLLPRSEIMLKQDKQVRCTETYFHSLTHSICNIHSKRYMFLTRTLNSIININKLVPLALAIFSKTVLDTYVKFFFVKIVG